MLFVPSLLQGPGDYRTALSAFQQQPESDKSNSARVGFTRARRKEEARRFISKHHSARQDREPEETAAMPGPGTARVSVRLRGLRSFCGVGLWRSQVSTAFDHLTTPCNAVGRPSLDAKRVTSDG